jgi:predicted RND superfamily exporter protein
MVIKELIQHSEFIANKQMKRAYDIFEKFLAELRKKELPDKFVISINHDIDELNAVPVSAKAFRKRIRKKQNSLLQILEKELKIVCKNHYRNSWFAIGMTIFGVPIGLAFGTSMGNMAFLGIGLPIGMVIGMAIGANMDKKAREEGRQLDIEIETDL